MGRKSKQHSIQKQERILAKSNNRCWYCGAQLLFECVDLEGVVWDEYHIDHVVPRTHGGSNDEDNLVAACHSCNSKKNNRTLEEFRLSLLVREASSPIERAACHIVAAINEISSAAKNSEKTLIQAALISTLKSFGQTPKKLEFYGENTGSYNLPPIKTLGQRKEVA